MENLMHGLSRVCDTMTYHEKKFLFNKDIYIAGIKICESNFYEDYVMYENDGEISIGIGRFATIIVRSNETSVTISGKNFNFVNEDISKTLNSIFKSIPVKNWRSYGIANFALAYHNYKLPLGDENQSLIKMFIPKLEIRIKEGQILTRALDIKDLDKINNIVVNLDSYNNKSDSLEYRIEKSKVFTFNKLEQNGDNYKDIVDRGVEDIKNGKYQKVILSRKILLNQNIDMLASYIVGRKMNNPARSYVVKFQELQVIGYSPETVAEVSKDGYVSTFPLAGTRAIGVNEEETNKLKQELLTDPKEIAEHAVSVKLAYEELEKVCESNSVHVNEFMSVLNRGTVQHLASRLKGKLKEGYNEWHAFNTLFPAVTASGIPKREAIEAISRLEQEPRNLYSGSILTYDSDGTMDAALVLRSAYKENDNTWLRAGAGIVKLSSPKRELQETCEKLRSVSKQLVSLE